MESQRACISSSIIETRAEEGPQGFIEGTFREGVDEGAVISDVVEGDNAILIIQENPNLARRYLKVEGRLGTGASLIFFFVPQPNCPETILSVHQKLPLPPYRVSANSQVPGLLSCHIYLPVQFSRVEALGTQDYGVIIKSLFIFWYILSGLSKSHLSSVL